MCNPSRRAILGSGLLTAAVQLCSPSRQIVFVQALSTITAPPTDNPSPLPPTPVGAKVLDEYSTELNELHRWDSLTSGCRLLNDGRRRRL